jgi:hypothetical protein
MTVVLRQNLIRSKITNPTGVVSQTSQISHSSSYPYKRIFSSVEHNLPHIYI